MSSVTKIKKSPNALVVAIASSALFDLTECDLIYRKHGVEKYKKFQEKNMRKPLKKGAAFPFIRRLLKLNELFPDEKLIEVILLSRNSHETGLRVFNSIRHYKLNIVKAGFFSGQSPYKYIPAFKASLFLSADERDVRDAISAGYAAGRIIRSDVKDNPKDRELRIAFDFDGVIAGEESELAYRRDGLKKYSKMEQKYAQKTLNKGPLQKFVKNIMAIRQKEIKKTSQFNGKYERILKISIVTARTSPSHERMVKTLKKWGIQVDQSFFLGDTKKKNVLEIMRPHIYFDDQIANLSDVHKIPLVHIPFGEINK